MIQVIFLHISINFHLSMVMLLELDDVLSY